MSARPVTYCKGNSRLGVISAIAKAIERYKKGERVIALAKELKVSRSAYYLWLEADRKAEEENTRLWAKVRELMLRYGEL